MKLSVVEKNRGGDVIRKTVIDTSLIAMVEWSSYQNPKEKAIRIWTSSMFSISVEEKRHNYDDVEKELTTLGWL